MPKQSYGNESITMLKGPDKVRKRPAVIFGSDGRDGCAHSVFEVITNSVDEARAGFGSQIIITRFLDGSFEVEDFGRGCPVDWNPREDRFNWELVYCELYAGGKYDAAADTYAYSLGLNGLGLCATQFAAEYMDVSILRDGKHYTLHFEQGENIGGLQIEDAPKKSHTGTKTRWKPDHAVFVETDIPDDWFRDVLKRQAVVNAGLCFTYRNEDTPQHFTETEFRYENGIVDYVEELLGGKGMTPVQFWQTDRKGRDSADREEYKLKLSVAVAFSNTVQRLEYYHNSSFLEHGGSPDDAVKRAFTAQIDAFLKANNRYQKNESKVSFADIQDCLVLVSSSFSTVASYENQTKKAITNRFIYEAMTDFLKHQLEVYFTENPDDAARIAEQVLVNKRSRENAERTRLNLKKKLSGNLDLSNMVAKFVDCRTKDTSRRELYIVEGDSALGSVKMARDAEFQAVMPVRGKILNCLKADYNRIFKSDIITDLLKVLGCGVEVTTKANKELATFSLENLRWHKIVICTDADEDGFHIRTLILTMIYRLAPTLIREGYVYIAESPLFEITTKERTYFAYDEKERVRILQMLAGQKYTLQRSKGLGENEAEMMALTTMNPATRRIIKVTPADAEATFAMFDMLLGDNLPARKDYIQEHGGEYLDFADIS